MHEDIKKFLKKLQGEHGITEISNTKQNLGGIDDYDKIIKRDEDLYFVSFLPVDNYSEFKGKRTKDSFVKGTTYFRADFDIRSAVYEQSGIVISNEVLMKYLEKIEFALKQDKLLRSYNAIMHSGNGFHFYWIGEEIQIDAEMYSNAARELLQRINTILTERRGYTELYSDFACSNISRLMRLPGSKNHKKKYGLEPIEVKLLYFDDTDSDLIPQLRDIGYEAMAKEEERVRDVIDIMKKGKNEIYISDNPLYVAINEKIDIAELVCKYTGWKLAENGKNFISNKDGGYTGAYILKNLNAVVRKGTPHFSNYFPIYSPFSFIQVHYADGDAKKTFEKVLELYPEMKAFDSHFLFNAMTKYGI